MSESPAPTANLFGRETPLEGWKEIGAYLQRTERTVRRWEKQEALPVYRQVHESRTSVYAFPSELDRWRAKRLPSTTGSPAQKWPPWRPLSAFASTIALAVLLLIAGSGPQVGTMNAQVAESTGPAVRMIWSDETTDLLGSPSPDGRYLSFTDWRESGNLAVRDLETGEIRFLTSEATGWDAFAECSEWSPDGAWVAYDWYLGPETGLDQLRLVPSGGGDARVLYDSAAHQQYTVVLGWSPDGDEVLVYVEGTGTTEDFIGAVSISDGELRMIRNARGWVAESSPDGGYILFTDTTDNGDTDVLLVSSDGEHTIPLVQHPAFDRAVGWSPDGRWVLFESDRTGRAALWAVRVENGEPDGEPRMIVPSLPANDYLGISMEGVLYLGNAASSGARDIYLAEIDPASGSLAKQPVKLVRRFEGHNEWPSFSRDGRFLAYVSVRDRRIGTLCILELATGVTREYPTGFERLYNPLWGPDNDAVVFVSRSGGDQMGLYRMDLDSGQVAELQTWRQGDGNGSHRLSPDGSTLYYSHRTARDAETSQIVAREIESGRERVLFTGAAPDWMLTLSPNGSQLAFLNRADERIVRIMSASGGAPREIFRYVNRGNHLTYPSWSADGRYLLLPKHDDADGTNILWSLWRLRVEDGRTEELHGGVGRPDQITAHPDGRRIAFSASDPERKRNAELWVMENFLPEAGSDE